MWFTVRTGRYKHPKHPFWVGWGRVGWGVGGGGGCGFVMLTLHAGIIAFLCKGLESRL